MRQAFNVGNLGGNLGGNFSPTDYAGLDLWLDASDASTMYDATTGGNLIAADGAIARWEDKSGNSRHATMATEAYKPIFRENAQNGLGITEWDTDANMDLVPFSQVAGNVIFVACDTTSTSSGWRNLLNRSGGGGNPALYIGADNYPNRSLIYAGAVRIVTGSANQAVSVYIFEINANDLAITVNGSTDTATYTASYSNWNGIGYSVSPFFQGPDCNIYEILVYQSLTADEKTQIQNYLKNKWAISF